MPNEDLDKDLTIKGFILQESPLIYLASIPGKWLLDRTTPSWRIEDPAKGFQRIIKEERARQIAVAVLDQGRTFPNSIVLATDKKTFSSEDCSIEIPSKIKFLVVDGQHRIWSQTYSSYDAEYSCVIHMGLSEEQMAYLFLEINDNQKRVPSSLRWDLVRLVRPEDDPYGIAAAELVYQLATDENSPLFQRIDLTGEQKEIQLKQGSLAPELKTLVSSKRASFFKLLLEEQYEIITQFLLSMKQMDLDGWLNGTSPFYKARVLRATLRLLPEIIEKIGREKATFQVFFSYLQKINLATLQQDQIVAIQGAAGMDAIYKLIKEQIF